MLVWSRSSNNGYSSTPLRSSQLPPSPAGSARLQIVKRVPARFGEYEMEPELVSVSVLCSSDRVLNRQEEGHIEISGERLMGSGVPCRDSIDIEGESNGNSQ